MVLLSQRLIDLTSGFASARTCLQGAWDAAHVVGEGTMPDRREWLWVKMLKKK